MVVTASGQVEKNLLEGGRVGTTFEGGERIASEEAPFMEDGDAVGEELDFRQRM